MKKLMISTALMLVSIQSFAQLNSKEFVNCFVKATNEVIVELQNGESQSKKKRLCNELSQKTIDRLTEKFSVVENGRLVYYSQESMGQERMIDLYDYIKNDMDCYGNAVEGQEGTLFGSIANTFSYNRNLKLADAAIDKMAGEDLWGKFFGESKIYNTLNELDLSYCK